jgi:surface protein
MQKRLLFIACLLLAIGQKMVAADGSDLITISDFSIYSGQSKEIGIELTNRDVYVGFQFDLQLPQGFTVSTYSANASRIPDGTSLRMAQQTDGSYRFVAAALDGSEISGNSGTVVNITVAADQSLTESSYTGYIRAIKLSKADGSGTTVSEEQPFTITVKGSEAYAALSDNNTVLTFYYDDQIDNRGGMSVADHGWSQFAGSITKVKFDSSFANYSPTSTAYWFSEMSALASIEGIDILSTVNVTDMQYMFFNCSSLTTLEVSGFKTENVTNMYRMFYGCSGLTTLDVSKFTTDLVTDMNGMFAECSKLTTLDLSSFNTSKVTNMNSMFSDCTSLTTIYVGDGWTLGSLQSGSGLFDNCTNLKGGAGTTCNSRHTD